MVVPNKNIYLGFYSCHWDGHDSSVSVIYDGKIYSLEVQRLKKVKNTSIKQYLNDNDYVGDVYLTCNYLLDNIDIIGSENNFNLVNFVKENSLYSLQKNGNDIDISNNFLLPEHHFLHACSVYYSSEFDNSTILTVDGAGLSQGKGCYECQGIYEGKGNEIIEKYTLKTSNNKGIGIGRAYEYFSNYIGLEEGSVMGLSSYGNSDKFNYINIFEFDGMSVILNKDLYNDYVNLDDIFGVKDIDYIERSKDITKSIFADIAAKLQKDTENAMIYIANIAYDIVKSDNLCIAGGVGLNILSNTKILENTKFKNIFICPATNDTGISLGSAYYGYHVLGGNKKRIPLLSAGLGVSYNNHYIKVELEKYNNYLNFSHINDFTSIANLLNNGKIIGWFQGGSEYGPRALGYRSILASPSDLKIKDRINKIKGREWWRPVAPSIIEDFISDFFETSYPSPFMALSSKVKIDKINIIPGVIHVDGTARYHTVNKINNEKFYTLLNDFYKLSGIPILINTSFNIKGQPIVENPIDAIEMFLSTDLDYLVIGDFIASKKSIYEEFRFNKFKHIFELKYRDEKSINTIIKRWKLLKKVLFNDFVKDEFNYDEGFFNFIYNLNNINYNISIGKKDGNGAYSTIGDIIIRVSVEGIGTGILDIGKDFSFILDKISNIINKNYEKLEKIIL